MYHMETKVKVKKINNKKKENFKTFKKHMTTVDIYQNINSFLKKFLTSTILIIKCHFKNRLIER